MPRLSLLPVLDNFRKMPEAQQNGRDKFERRRSNHLPVDGFGVLGSLSGPIVGASANLVARFVLQKKISQAEYDFRRLDLVEKAIAVERTLGEKVQSQIGMDILLAEYHQVIDTIASNRAREDAKAASRSERSSGVRVLILL